MQIKTTQSDKWFSKCVRERTNWTCEYCGADFNHDRAGLDCSHFIGRGNKMVRVHPLNAFAHCKRSPGKNCHEKLGGGRWGGGNIAEFAKHYDEIHGAENRELMRVLSSMAWKGYKHLEKAMSKHYRMEHRRMEALRADGEQGRIEFDIFPDGWWLGVIAATKKELGVS